MIEAGVPVVPGSKEPVHQADEALEMAGREGDREKIDAATPALLRQCQELGETLAFLKEPE